jgi:hypothetical protein
MVLRSIGSKCISRESGDGRSVAPCDIELTNEFMRLYEVAQNTRPLRRTCHVYGTGRSIPGSWIQPVFVVAHGQE